jgi:CPW-WPC domain-containing protein
MLRKTTFTFALVALVALCALVTYSEAANNCRNSCPDGWKKRYDTMLRCDSPRSYKGPCNRNSKFPENKYPNEKKVQWAINCGVPYTACGYTQEMVDGHVETPDWEDFREDDDEL